MLLALGIFAILQFAIPAVVASAILYKKYGHRLIFATLIISIISLIEKIGTIVIVLARPDFVIPTFALPSLDVFRVVGTSMLILGVIILFKRAEIEDGIIFEDDFNGLD